MTKHSKLCLACSHLFKGKRQKAYLVWADTPINAMDTGKIYTCLKCAKKEPASEREFNKMLSTYCIHCLKNRCL